MYLKYVEMLPPELDLQIGEIRCTRTYPFGAPVADILNVRKWSASPLPGMIFNKHSGFLRFANIKSSWFCSLMLGQTNQDYRPLPAPPAALEAVAAGVKDFQPGKKKALPTKVMVKQTESVRSSFESCTDSLSRDSFIFCIWSFKMNGVWWCLWCYDEKDDYGYHDVETGDDDDGEDEDKNEDENGDHDHTVFRLPLPVWCWSSHLLKNRQTSSSYQTESWCTNLT